MADKHKPAGETVIISVAMVGMTLLQVEIVHAGARYSIDREDIISIMEDDTAQAAAMGSSVNVLMQVKAEVLDSFSLKPSVVGVPVRPFGLRNPAEPIPFAQTSADKAWRERVGYPFSANSKFRVAETIVTSMTDSYSGGVKDDSLSDRHPND
jgi:hypothetical protein